VERKKAERNHDLLASIVESSDDAIIGMTLDGEVVSWNRGATRVYGYDAPDILGKPISLLFAADGLDELRENIAAARRGAIPHSFATSRNKHDCNNNFSRPKRWKPSAGWPRAWLMTSTIC
jgi:PAS domain S-box-containing protein